MDYNNNVPKTIPAKEFIINKTLCDKDAFEEYLRDKNCDVIVTLFYGNGEARQELWKVRSFTKTSSLNSNLGSGYLRNWRSKGITGIKLEIK